MKGSIFPLNRNTAPQKHTVSCSQKGLMGKFNYSHLARFSAMQIFLANLRVKTKNLILNLLTLGKQITKHLGHFHEMQCDRELLSSPTAKQELQQKAFLRICSNPHEHSGLVLLCLLGAQAGGRKLESGFGAVLFVVCIFTPPYTPSFQTEEQNTFFSVHR